MESNFYQILTAMTLIAWLFFIWQYKTQIAKTIFKGVIFINILAYLFFIFGSFAEAQGSLLDLEGYRQALITSNKGLLGGWLHYLVVDPILGLWVVEHRKIDRALRIRPILFVCAFMAPLGLLLHWLIPQKQKTLF